MERMYRIENNKSKGKFLKNLKWVRTHLPKRLKQSDLVEYELREVGRIPISEYLRNNEEVEIEE